MALTKEEFFEIMGKYYGNAYYRDAIRWNFTCESLEETKEILDNILKTKIRGTALDHMDFRTPYNIEIPTENGILTVVGEYIGGILGVPEFEIININ